MVLTRAQVRYILLRLVDEDQIFWRPKPKRRRGITMFVLYLIILAILLNCRSKAGGGDRVRGSSMGMST